tara:strand:+ start:14660 stop:15547 length:888 start_codon:yes stop_codon:yes gene_type:complete
MVEINKYRIEDFNIILKNMIFERLDDDVKNTIDNLCQQVIIDDKDKDKSNYYRNKKSYNNNLQWQSIRNFQKTKIVKNDVDFDIRNILNKITDKNYDSQKDELINRIDKINKDDNYDKNLNNIYNIIKDIIKNNIYFSIIYAKLCRDLFHVNKFFLEKVIEDGKQLSKDLLLIENNKDKNNYNNLCNHNKNNDQKKSILLFFLNIFKNDRDNFNILTNILDKILEKFEKNIIKIEEKENNEDLTELLFIIMTNIDELDDKYKKKIIEISNYKVKNYSGLSNKIIFKLMDILDKYK